MNKIIIMIALLFICQTGFAEMNMADEAEQLIFDDLAITDVNQFVADINQEISNDEFPRLPELTMDKLKELMQFGVNWDIKSICRLTLNTVLENVVTEMRILSRLIFLGMLCLLLKKIQTEQILAETGQLAYAVCLIFLLVIVMQVFGKGMEIVKDTVDKMVVFMEAVLPLLFSAMLAVGGITKSALLSPLLLGTVNMVSIIIRDIVLPLLFASTMLTGVNYISGDRSLQGLSGVLKQSSIVVMGFFMMLFIGMVTIQGATGSVADGLALRTAKFATANFVPVAGRAFSDTVEIVGAAGMLIKNAIGLFGVIIIGLLCFVPVVKVFVMGLIMKVTSACLEPLGDIKLAGCMSELGTNLLLLGGMLLAVAVMFFIMLAMLMGAVGLMGRG